MSSTKAGYTVLTPEFADFPVPNILVPTASSLHPREIHSETPYRRKLDAAWSQSRRIVKNNTGLLLVVLSQAFFSSMDLVVKILHGVDPPVSTLEVIIARMGVTYVCSVTYMSLVSIPDPILGPKEVRSLLMLRGFAGFFGLFGIYYSLQYLSLSDTTVLNFLTPMCTTLAGSIFLAERFSHREILAGFISLLGVILIARPAAIFGDSSGQGTEKGTPRDRLIAVGVSLIGVLGTTGTYISIRAIGKRAHPLHSLTYFAALCVIMSTAGLIINKTPFIIPDRLEWLVLLAMIGIFGLLAQTLLVMGLQRETAGRGSMALYTQIIFATILQKIFFHATPSTLSIVGTLLIIGSALYIVLTKETQSAPGAQSISLQQRAAESVELEESLFNLRDNDQDDLSMTSQIPPNVIHHEPEGGVAKR